MTSFFRFIDKRAIYRWYNLIRTCAGECDWLFHWQHKLCAAFSANVNINYRLPIKAYYRICTLRHIRYEMNKPYISLIYDNILMVRPSAFFNRTRGRLGRDRMVVGFTTTYAISAYHHWCCEFESRSGRGVHWNMSITETLLKVALKTINLTKPNHQYS
jgi:hypothetical protein